MLLTIAVFWSFFGRWVSDRLHSLRVIHVLLVLAVIVVLIRVIQGRVSLFNETFQLVQSVARAGELRGTHERSPPSEMNSGKRLVP